MSFNKITQIMYEEGYVMVNLYDLAGLDDDGNMKAKTVYLPEARRPLYYHRMMCATIIPRTETELPLSLS